MKPVLIVRTGRAPDVIAGRHGDFPRWFRLGLRLKDAHLRIVDVQHGDPLPDPDECAGAVITGSASMVTEKLAWSERTAGWIRDAMDSELPLFGVCYGHQLMSHALGGRIDYLPGGREMGTVRLRTHEHAASDSLGIALPAEFHAHATHEQSVLELPRRPRRSRARIATRIISCAMAPMPSARSSIPSSPRKSCVPISGASTTPCVTRVSAPIRYSRV